MSSYLDDLVARHGRAAALDLLTRHVEAARRESAELRAGGQAGLSGVRRRDAQMLQSMRRRLLAGMSRPRGWAGRPTVVLDTLPREARGRPLHKV